jgi:hypothetical protein
LRRRNEKYRVPLLDGLCPTLADRALRVQERTAPIPVSSIDRLWSLRRLVFGLGLLQVVVTTVIIGVIAWVVGTPGRNAVIIGMCLALSSTAIVMQLPAERREIASKLG